MVYCKKSCNNDLVIGGSMEHLLVGGMADALLVLSCACLLFGNEYFSHQYAGDGAAQAPRLTRFLAGGVLRGLVWLAGWVFHLPMVALYLLLLAASCLNNKAQLAKNDKHVVFLGALFFVRHVVIHTSLVAVLSLYTGQTLRQVYYDSYLLLVFFSELVPAVAAYFFTRWGDPAMLLRVVRDSGQFRECLSFALYTVVYYCFDAMLVEFELPYWQVSAFLLGSCVLMTFQLLLFIRDTDSIIRLVAYKGEYNKLEKQRAEQVRQGIALQNLAYRDSLTGAFNRRYAEEMLRSLQKDYPRITVAYIDVDGLKKVNDAQGHQTGDKYLCTVADCLNNALLKTDVLARIGGDEFLVISINRREGELTAALCNANRILRSGAAGFAGSFSYGVVETDGDDKDIEALLRESDRRMYQNKTANPAREVSRV